MACGGWGGRQWSRVGGDEHSETEGLSAYSGAWMEGVEITWLRRSCAASKHLSYGPKFHKDSTIPGKP